MFIVVTQIRLKSISKFFKFNATVNKIAKQINQSEGNKHFSKRAKWYLDFYTLTAWDDWKAMLEFRSSGSHLEAMGITRELSDHFRVSHWEADHVPTWKEAFDKIDKALWSVE
ncbi:hypothetical protein JYT36_00380 [Bacteroidales bacterium AH-315-N07]|nr:hypothetical protein [Bacteroidales bacterium AH-315-N07]